MKGLFGIIKTVDAFSLFRPPTKSRMLISLYLIYDMSIMGILSNFRRSQTILGDFAPWSRPNVALLRCSYIVKVVIPVNEHSTPAYT